MLTVFLGVYGSMYLPEMQARFPFVCWLPSDRCTFYGEWFPVALFWALVFVLGWMTWATLTTEAIRQQVSDDTIKQNQQALTEVSRLVRTMPPREFTQFYAKSYGRMHAAKEAVWNADSVDVHSVEKAIRVMLSYIIKLAHYWDTHRIEPSEALVYRANIMDLRAGSLHRDGKPLESLLGALRFADTDAIRRANTGEVYKSYLRVSRALSTSTLVDDTEVDTDIEPLFLVVNPQGGLLFMVPGAPYAAAKCIPMWIADTHAMWDLCEDQQGLSPYREDIQQFYSADSKARSILSIPLPPSPMLPDTKQLTGVLNIYREEAMMFSDKERALQFAELMTPVGGMLADLLALYIQVEGHV